MAIRTILHYPDPRLRQKAQPVTNVTPEIQRLIEDMAETMYAAPGVGLAATQIGEPHRIFIVDIAAEDEPSNLMVFINPEILDPSEDLSVYSEGCLSVPEIYADVERPARIRARWQDLDGTVHEEDMEGLMATCLQHEMDHLEGILFIDHLSRLKRQMALKKLDKLRKAA